jgi:hypothetical protein
MNNELITSKLRDLSISLLFNKVDFNINRLSYVEKIRFQSALDMCKYFNLILTGSLVLKCFGLIERETSDIDVLIDLSGDKEKISEIKKYQLLDTSYEEEYYIDTRLIMDCSVDFFRYSDQPTIELDILVVHNPIDILKDKLNMGINLRIDKHMDDYKFIINKFSV